MTTIRNGQSSRTARAGATTRTPGRRTLRGRTAPVPMSLVRPRQRPTVRLLPPLTHRGVRPLLRLVISNPNHPAKGENRPRHHHLTLVGATAQLPAAVLAPTGEPWETVVAVAATALLGRALGTMPRKRKPGVVRILRAGAAGVEASL